MMLRNLLLSVCVMLVLVATLLGHELIPIGTLPKLDSDWEIWVDDQQTKTEPSLRFHWAVFRNKKSGDFLSFATLPPETGKKRRLEYWTDTAREIFPDGQPVWTQRRSDATNDETNIVLAPPVSSKRQDVLGFCFVSEASGRDNLMAHVRVCVCQKGIVFISHTSTRPITPEIVEDTVWELLKDQQESTVSKTP